MANPVYRYRLDPTGTNPDNLIVGEQHAIGVLTGTQKYRAVAPLYGPVFTDSVQIYDHNTNRLLQRGTDYVIVELLQEASMRYAKEIASIILIQSPTVTANIRVSYQALGGLYQYSAEKIADLYNKVMTDNRPVDWANIMGKPTEYPPSLHQHLVKDVYGFEVLVAALERVRNAIVLSDVPAFEAVIQYALQQVVSELDIDLGENTNRLISLERLLYAGQLHSFNTVIMGEYPSIMARNANVRIDFTITNYMRERSLFWTVDHITTDDDDFAAVSGLSVVDRQKSFLSFVSAPAIGVEDDKTFKVSLRTTSPDGPIIYSTDEITLRGNTFSIGDDSVAGNYWLAATDGCRMKTELTPGRLYYLYMADDLAGTI